MVVQAPEIIGVSIEPTCPLRLFQSISLISTLSPLNHLSREFVQQDANFPHQNPLQIIRTSKLPLSLLELGTL